MLRRFRQIPRVLPCIFSGIHYQRSGQPINPFSTPLPHAWKKVNGGLVDRGCQAYRAKFPITVPCRFSTISELSHESCPEVEILPFIESAFDSLEGPSHCWLNKVEESKNFSKRDRIFLVLAGVFCEDSLMLGFDSVVMFEKLKSLQQRYPLLHVMGFLSGCSSFSGADKSHLLQIIMKEYITFPILLSNKDFSEMAGGACYILFKEFRSPLIYHEKDVDVGTLNKAVEELYTQDKGESATLQNWKSNGLKLSDSTKEPYVGSLQNLLLYYPGCISVDESGNRLFLSDSNHHRIIIFSSNGKILDCIGSAPGFEDGEFESAKLGRPAASFYHADEDCLYFVDSENHAIRRADMGTRVLETLYPPCNTNKKKNGLWSWIVNKLGMEKDTDTKPAEFDSGLLMFPWHLIKLVDGDLFIINRSFETLWIMALASGEIKEVVRGTPKVLEICGEMIMEKLAVLNKMPHDWLQQQVDSNFSLEGIPYAGLMSSLATFQDDIVICDTVAQRILRLNGESGDFTNLEFSNFGILGLPYWFSFPLERVCAVGNLIRGANADHFQSFSFLPGKINIQLMVEIPEDTELVEPLQDGCIWRLARGAAAVVSGAEDLVASSAKVGVAQQWYDELDNLAFFTPEPESDAEEENTTLDTPFQEEKVRIDCAVNTSPGTSEVIVYAALYLKLKRNPNSQERNPEKNAARILNILEPEKSGKITRESCIQFLSKWNEDVEDLIFMKPLHVRIGLESLSHPKAENAKETVLTETSIQVNVLL